MTENNLQSNSVTPVILAGGSGTRLWPLSRKTYPKQFSQLLGSLTLFQQAALRFDKSHSLHVTSPIIITNSDFRFIVAEQLRDIGVINSEILIEPTQKNTAAAILAATIHASKTDPNAILLFAPSDHIIPDTLSFQQSVIRGLSQVRDGKIVTFGIQPNKVETGYGYLKVGRKLSSMTYELSGFYEKPDFATAKKFVSNGDYLWNAGIFMCKAADMLKAFQHYADDLVPHVTIAVEQSQADLDFIRLSDKGWENCREVSIDYAIMENADNLVAIKYTGEWSDLGDWSAAGKYMGPDDQGVALSENAHAIDCKDTILRSESGNQQIVGLGLEEIVAVAMSDAVLVANKSRTQDVKRVVETLRSQGLSQAEIFPKDHRPWGWFESLSIGEKFQVKRILVNPGASLSLQSHRHRSEHWVVVSGRAKVTVDDQITFLSEGESVYIPLGAKHRMENEEQTPMMLIEIQTGTYFGEDDIIRFEDRYARD